MRVHSGQHVGQKAGIHQIFTVPSRSEDCLPKSSSLVVNKRGGGLKFCICLGLRVWGEVFVGGHSSIDKALRRRCAVVLPAQRNAAAEMPACLFPRRRLCRPFGVARAAVRPRRHVGRPTYGHCSDWRESYRVMPRSPQALGNRLSEKHSRDHQAFLSGPSTANTSRSW